MAAALLCSRAWRCKFQLVKRSHAIIYRSSALAQQSSSSLNDTKTSSLPSSIRETFSSLMNIRSVITGATNSSVDVSKNDNEAEWEALEVQTCISKELQQRVLVCNFLKSGSVMTSSTSISEDSPDNHIVTIAKVTATLQRLLVSSRLCFSSLYNSSLSSVCPNDRLDFHFIAQMQTLYRDLMWDNLKDAFLSMEEYVKVVEATALISQQTLEPIYRQHGLQITSTLPKRVTSEFVYIDSSLSPTAASDFSPLNSSVGDPSPMNNYYSNTKEDGMTKCLRVLGKTLADLQFKYFNPFH